MTTWWHAINGERIGPKSDSEIAALRDNGTLDDATPVWRDGWTEWKAIGLVPELAASAPPPLEDSVSHLPPPLPDTAPSLPECQGSADSGSHGQRGNYFARHWRGALSLGVSYWANGFLANVFLLAVIYAAAGFASGSRSDYNFVFYWVGVYAVAFLVVIWQLTGIWRSANNHVARTNRRFWAGAAKVAVVLGLFRFLGDFTGTGVPAIRESIEQGSWLSKNSKWEINLLRGGSEIEVRGGVGRGISADIEKFLTAAPSVNLVHLNLEVGGLVEEGQKLNAMFRERRLATYVSSACVSACSIAFMGGVERYLRSGAKLGFHAYKVPGVSTSETNFTDSKLVLIASGLSSGFADRIFETSPDSMWYPTPEELLRDGVVTAMVSGDEFGLSGFQRQGALAKVESGLLANNVYRAIQQREPELFKTILKQFQDGIQSGRSLDEIRPTVTPYMQQLREKYLPYASDEAVKAVAVYSAQVTKMLRSSPSICLGYLRDGEPQATNAAIKMYPPGLAEKELDLLGELIRSADLSRILPPKAEKDKALDLVLRTAVNLLGERAGIMSELGNPTPDPTNWCDSFYAVYLAVGSLPPSQARVATLALVEN